MRATSGLIPSGPSPIRAMHANAPPGAVSLGLGEPTWDLHPAAVEALASLSGPCRYGPNEGVPALAEAVRSRFARPGEDAMIGAGSQAVLFALFQAWAGSGDTILVPDPGFVSYPTLATMAGAVPVPYELAPDGTLNPDAFLKAASAFPDSAMAIVNVPSNPTGGGCAKEALATIASACRERGILLVSDEVYRELHLSREQVSLRDAAPDGIVVSSLSKAWGAPGLRVGWATGDASILSRARLVHNAMTSCVSMPSQVAAVALLGASEEVTARSREELGKRWEALSGSVSLRMGLEPTQPSGGFYWWTDLPRGAGTDATVFCLRARDESGVIVIPGNAFGEQGEGKLRISFSGKPEDIREGISRLSKYWS